MTSANIPNTITELKYGLFYNCSSLKEISIPASVKAIGPRVFGGCSSLTTIAIPATVTRMDYGIFEHCTGLTSIYAYQTTPIDLSASYYALVFNDVNKNGCILNVPIGSKPYYSVAVEWKDFTNIIEMPTTYTNLINENIKIYPNPVKKSFSVTGLNEAARIILTDLNGKQVINRQTGVGESIPVSGLTKGLYILRIVTSEGTLERKLIKE